MLSASSGAEAIMLAASAAPDLVVLDLGLPDVPGEAVARELRAAGSVPILMLTAKAGEEDRIAGLELGADDFVTKPFSPRGLVLRVQAILRRGARPRPRDRSLRRRDAAHRHTAAAGRRARRSARPHPDRVGILGALATSRAGCTRVSS